MTIKFAAPAHETYTTEDDKWASRPWTRQGVLDVKSYGGWFRKGLHSFESREVAKLAGISDDE